VVLVVAVDECMGKRTDSVAIDVKSLSRRQRARFDSVRHQFSPLRAGECVYVRDAKAHHVAARAPSMRRDVEDSDVPCTATLLAALAETDRSQQYPQAPRVDFDTWAKCSCGCSEMLRGAVRSGSMPELFCDPEGRLASAHAADDNGRESVSVQSVTVSAVCPITQGRIVVPCLLEGCSHAQPFDLLAATHAASTVAKGTDGDGTSSTPLSPTYIVANRFSGGSTLTLRCPLCSNAGGFDAVRIPLPFLDLLLDEPRRVEFTLAPRSELHVLWCADAVIPESTRPRRSTVDVD
jgi:hypothetical protein